MIMSCFFGKNVKFGQCCQRPIFLNGDGSEADLGRKSWLKTFLDSFVPTLKNESKRLILMTYADKSWSLVNRWRLKTFLTFVFDFFMAKNVKSANTNMFGFTLHRKTEKVRFWRQKVSLSLFSTAGFDLQHHQVRLRGLNRPNYYFILKAYHILIRIVS